MKPPSLSVIVAEKALIEMYIVGVSVRRAEDISEALIEMYLAGVSVSTISEPMFILRNGATVSCPVSTHISMLTEFTRGRNRGLAESLKMSASLSI